MRQSKTEKPPSTRPPRSEIGPHLEQAFWHARDIMLVLGRDGRILDCNEAAVAAYGHSYDDMLRLGIEALYAPESLAAFEQDLKFAWRDGGSVFEAVHRRKDGATFPVEVSSNPLSADDDSVRLSVIRDISERIHLMQERERYFRFFNLSIDPMCIADPFGRFLRVNPAFVELTGYEESELAARPFLDFVLPEDRERTVQEMKLQVAVRPTMNFENRYVCKDGRQIHLSWTAHFDKVDGVTYATAHDVTGRKLMASAVERERTRLRTILRMASDGLHVMDSDGLLVEASDSFLNMLGYDGTAIGKLHIPDWDAHISPADISSIVSDIIARQDQMVFETRHRRSNGEIFDVEVNVSGIEIEGKGYVYAAARDITERKRTEQELRIAAKAFEAQEGIVITDANNIILRVNRAFTEITGYTAEEAVGKTPGLLNSGHHDAAFYAEMWASLRDQGVWQGEIWNRRKGGETYPEWLTITTVKDDAGEVINYVAMLTDITLRKAAEEEIKYLAFYDSLTGLPNRRLLLDRLQQTLTASARHNRHGALMLLDMDNFKTLNDTLGHDVGDRFLVAMAGRLQACVRKGDTVARQGGDEFVVILEDLGKDGLAAMQAESIAVKMLQAIADPYELETGSGVRTRRYYHTSASIGITLFRGNSSSVEELMKRADTAMYRAKAGGRSTLRFFDPEMQAAVATRASLEADLREALRENQFLLLFQPQVDGVGHLIGAEAVIRWRHPVRGLVYPADFIFLAEEMGLILPIGQWVLRMACNQLKTWAARPETADLTLAVNVSALQFRHPDFVRHVQTALEESGADPRKLKLELTESLLLDDMEDIIAKMGALKTSGVGFALDDFGTGYSSLSYLKRLPLDQLKIDQSFVRDILFDSNDAAIARTIVALAQSMGLGVIAEGVESEAQREFLAGLGCGFYQGYLFGPPLSVDDFGRFVERCH